MRVVLKRLYLPFAGLTLLLFLQACAMSRPAAPPVVDVDAAGLLHGLRLNARQWQGLRGLAKVKVESPQRNFGASQVLLAEKPDRLRAETLSMFGQPILLLASDGSQMQVLVPSQNRFYQGPANDRNLQRFANLPMRMTDLVHLLLYQVPLLENVDRLETSANGPALTLSGAGGQQQKLQFNNRLQLIRSRLLQGGDLWLDIEYSEFSAENGFPHRIELELPRHQARLEVNFSKLEINPSFKPQLFVLARPAGAQLIQLPGD